MATYRLIFSPESAVDLQAIHDWIAKDSPRNAARTIDRILADIDGLCEIPQRFAVVPSKRKLPWPLRRLPIPPFRVLYWIEEEKLAVRILVVQHGRQQSPD